MSGIYIPGMEMPTSCYGCHLRKRIGLNIVCPVSNEEFAVADVNILYYRLDNCPLVPIPEHGRLIELVSAKERLPEVGKPVLCACRANIYEVMKMRTDGAWVHNDAVYDSAYMGGFVTHWAELPTIIPAEEGEG